MKEIKAIVRPSMADKVLDALRAAGHLPGITMSSVRGFSRSGAETDQSAEAEDAPMTKIEVVVPDDLLDGAVALIAESARTGRAGDGKIFVYAVQDVIRIQTGERGEAAI